MIDPSSILSLLARLENENQMLRGELQKMIERANSQKEGGGDGDSEIKS